MSADGPKALRLAGELADGAVISVGSASEATATKIDAVRAGAEEAGRDPDAIEIWAMSFCSVRDTRADALAEITAFLAVIAGLGTLAPRVMAAIPEELVPRVREMQARYDPTQHTVVGGSNARLIEELDLVDYFAAENAIAGSPSEVRAHIGALADLGVSCLLVALSGQADATGTLHRMMAARSET
jgi:alkanesulfonate monooxygenase SsuD/methylene tetrahydromethanopterin reductase-like flavin-dependent oxidoreductase (luciferase family)